jgi:hypothetical protein
LLISSATTGRPPCGLQKELRIDGPLRVRFFFSQIPPHSRTFITSEPDQAETCLTHGAIIREPERSQKFTRSKFAGIPSQSVYLYTNIEQAENQRPLAYCSWSCWFSKLEREFISVSFRSGSRNTFDYPSRNERLFPLYARWRECRTAWKAQSPFEAHNLQR